MRTFFLCLVAWWLVGDAGARAASSSEFYDLKTALRFRLETNAAWACPRILSVYLRVENPDATDCTWTFDPVDIQARIGCVTGGIRAEMPPLSIRLRSRTKEHRIPSGSAVDLKMSASTELVNAYGADFDLMGRTVLMVGTTLWLIANEGITDQVLALQVDSRPWCLAGRLPTGMRPNSLDIPWTRVSLRKSPNETVQRPGVSGSAQETNRTSSATGFGR